MTEPVPIEPALDPCGCCDEEDPGTLRSTVNRPGLPALSFRVGTHATFKAAMLLDIARQSALKDFTTRDSDDPAVAEMDGVAAVLDVLTFYEERYVNEGFLRTATERQSIQWLARMVGYKLRPGIAAQVYLAFEIEGAVGAPGVATIDIGTKAQTIPGPDEKPQTFETVEKIVARAVWNRFYPQKKRVNVPQVNATTAAFAGSATNLRPGDGLLFLKIDNPSQGASWAFRQVTAALPDKVDDLLAVTWDSALTWSTTLLTSAEVKKVIAHDAPGVYAFALRTRAALFGHNAPDVRSLPAAILTNYGITGTVPNEWPNMSLSKVGVPGSTSTNPADALFLDLIYPQIVKDSWIVVTAPGETDAFVVNAVVDDSRSDFTLTAKTTRITLDSNRPASLDAKLRQIVVFGQSDALAFAEEPVVDDVSANQVTLDISDAALHDLLPGRTLIVAGLDAAQGTPDAQVMTLDHIALQNSLAQLFFTQALLHPYNRASTSIYGNVALATHGESKTETLGGGNAAQPFQQFVLKGIPLTYLQTTAPHGQSTLTVQVNDVRWNEVPALYGHGPRERIFITYENPDGSTTVEGGDGATGARFPSGDENIVARYRVGSGLAGVAKAEQIKLLLTRPLGVKAVVNPRPAEGGVDPELADLARQNAPLTVLTFDRVVSLRDFEDFARTFPGIGKAQAVWLWDGRRQIVHITVAGNNGQVIGSHYSTFDNLKLAIAQAQSVQFVFRLDPYQSKPFAVQARILVDPAYDADKVSAAVKAALLDAFGFARRAFGQPVAASEILSVMQAVAGITALRLENPGLDTLLAAQTAHVDPVSGIVGAELVTVDPNQITLIPVKRLEP